MPFSGSKSPIECLEKYLLGFYWLKFAKNWHVSQSDGCELIVSGLSIACLARYYRQAIRFLIVLVKWHFFLPLLGLFWFVLELIPLPFYLLFFWLNLAWGLNRVWWFPIIAFMENFPFLNIFSRLRSGEITRSFILRTER